MAAKAHNRHMAADLYARSAVIDGLNGSGLTPRVIAALREASITAINLTAVELGGDFAAALRDLAKVTETVARHADQLMIVREPGDVSVAKETRRTGIILGMQDAEPIERDLSRLRTLAELGVRIIQLTHNRQSFIGTGCAERDSGLTKFGRKVVDEMNRLGLMVDLSHCGPQTTLEAIEHSAVPVICSHSNPKAIADSPRNKDDALIRRLAERGGMIGIATWSPIVYRGKGERPTLADVLDCFDHVIRLIGPDHVLVGSDLCDDALPSVAAWEQIYGAKGSYPEVTGGLGDWYRFETVNAAGFETIDQFPDLAAGLLARGHGEAHVTKILGGNFMRLFEQVRRAAR